MPVVFGLCKGRKRDGSRCRGVANVTGYCPNHPEQASEEDLKRIGKKQTRRLQERARHI